MYVTEEEARGRFCPFAQQFSGFVGDFPISATDKGGYSIPPGRCGGSACMAWEFIDNEWEFIQPGKDLEAIFAGTDFPHFSTAEAAEAGLPEMDARAADLGWSVVPGAFHMVRNRYRRVRADRRGECQRAVRVEDNS